MLCNLLTLGSMVNKNLTQTSEFALQTVDLTQVWPNVSSGIIGHDDLLASAVYIYVKLHFTAQQKFTRSLLEPLTAIEAPLLQRQPDDVPELRDGHTILQVVHWDFRILQHLGYEATFTDPLAFLAIQLAATHIRNVPFSLTSTGSQRSIADWVVLLWCRLCSFTQD